MSAIAFGMRILKALMSLSLMSACFLPLTEQPHNEDFPWGHYLSLQALGPGFENSSISQSLLVLELDVLPANQKPGLKILVN